MPRITIFGAGISAKSPFVTAKKMTNIYAEVRPQGEKAAIVGYGTPGLSLFIDFGDTPCRGGLDFEPGSVCYIVHRGVLWEVNNAGGMTNRGALLTTSGRVSMAHNGTQIMIVDGTYGYIYNTSTLAFAQITDVDFPASPITVTFLAGRFIISLNGSSRFYASDLYDGLAWDALNFATAESSPDPIVAAWASNGEIMLLGSLTSEFWGNSGALDFAFTALHGTATEWGLAARWSVAKFDNSIACLIKNRMGQVMVAMMAGYLPKPISNPDLDAIINSYPGTADATAYSYMLGGHPMYVITFPSAGYSWLYDGSTELWSALKSSGINRHRAEFSFGLLGNTMVADYALGRVYRLLPTALTDNGDPIEHELISENIAQPDLSRLTVDKVRVNMEVGNGLTSGQGENPQIALSISRDNGKTWGPEIWKLTGRIGQYMTRVEWRRCGTAREFSFKFRMTDPVPFTIIDACINPDD